MNSKTTDAPDLHLQWIIILCVLLTQHQHFTFYVTVIVIIGQCDTLQPTFKEATDHKYEDAQTKECVALSHLNDWYNKSISKIDALINWWSKDISWLVHRLLCNLMAVCDHSLTFNECRTDNWALEKDSARKQRACRSKGNTATWDLEPDIFRSKQDAQRCGLSQISVHKSNCEMTRKA